MAEEKPLDGPSSGETQAGSQAVKAFPGPLAIGPWMGLVFACLAGLLMWVFLQTAYPLFVIPPELADVPPTAPVEKLMEQQAAMHQADLHNAMLALGLFGVLLGGLLGFAEGAARHSWAMALAAAIGCGLVTGLAGILAGFLGHSILLTPGPLAPLSPLARTVCMQAIMLATLGGGVGLSVGALSKRWGAAAACLLAGLLAGALAGMLFPMLLALFMRTTATEVVITFEGGTRLLWVGLTAVLLGVSIPRAVRSRGPKEDLPPPGGQTST